MPRRILKKKPLLEAIFELRWSLKPAPPARSPDPHYGLLVGAVYERLKHEYPFHEQLPTAMLPEGIAAYVVQHRFRKGENQWPLVQLGPGIITANDTAGYVWDDFEKRISTAVAALIEAYPDSADNLTIAAIVLRYIDAIPFDFDKQDILSFLRDKMKTHVALHDGLFADRHVRGAPSAVDLRFSFSSQAPKGTVLLRFSRGVANDLPSLMWETVVESTEGDGPAEIDEITGWIRQAHALTDDWFFKLIEGELLEGFEPC